MADGTTEPKRMAISAYAKLRHTTPQSVHYYIRNNRLQKQLCDCGRYVIDIEEADAVMGFKKKEGEPNGK